MRVSDALTKVTSNGLCSGCGACAAAIVEPPVQMYMSKAGYLRPKTDGALSSESEKLFNDICPGRRLPPRKGVADINDDVWGSIQSLWIGHASDPEVRQKGSSGGVLSAISIALVESGLVEFVLTTGADANDPLGNSSFPRFDRTAIVKTAGSRYAPSSPLAELEYSLSLGKKFAFIGKPCDVAALRRLAKVDTRIVEQIPYMLSFFCAGVPSRLGSLRVLEAMGISLSEVSTFQFRGDGWPGLTRAKCVDGREYTMKYSESWGVYLNKYLQFRCKICPDGTGESADIVCADAWYGLDGYPTFEEKPGRSLILARTKLGSHLIESLAMNGAIQISGVTVDEMCKMQEYQISRKRRVLGRSLALWVSRRTGPLFLDLRLLRLARGLSVTEQIRNALGCYRRVRGRGSLD